MFPWNFFPFNKEMQTKMKLMQPDELNKYIQEMMGNMGNMFQQSQQGNNMNPLDMMKIFQQDQRENTSPSSPQSNPTLHCTVYETHHDIFVRIRIETEEWLERLKLYHTSHLLIVENIPEEGAKQTISLPAPVRRKGTTAQYKDQILEVKIPKNVEMQYSQVDITEI